jgi:hypothetical protein
MTETKLKVKCSCGRNDLLDENEADNLQWNEDQSLTCHCSKKILFLGHGKLKNNGAAWVEVDLTNS